MNDKKILKMLSDIVAEVDYDIWKEMFRYYPDDCEDLECTENMRDAMVSIVKKHLKKEMK